MLGCRCSTPSKHLKHLITTRYCGPAGRTCCAQRRGRWWGRWRGEGGGADHGVGDRGGRGRGWEGGGEGGGVEDGKDVRRGCDGAEGFGGGMGWDRLWVEGR